MDRVVLEVEYDSKDMNKKDVIMASDLLILTNERDENKNGKPSITGEIENISNKSIPYVSVIVAFYQDDKIIYSEKGRDFPIKKGYKKDFEISLNKQLKYDSYKIYISGFIDVPDLIPPPDDAKAIEIVDSSYYMDEDSLRVCVKIKNPNKKYAFSGGCVEVSVYDEKNSLIGSVDMLIMDVVVHPEEEIFLSHGVENTSMDIDTLRVAFHVNMSEGEFVESDDPKAIDIFTISNTKEYLIEDTKAVTGIIENHRNKPILHGHIKVVYYKDDVFVDCRIGGSLQVAANGTISFDVTLDCPIAYDRYEIVPQYDTNNGYTKAPDEVKPLEVLEIEKVEYDWQMYFQEYNVTIRNPNKKHWLSSQVILTTYDADGYVVNSGIFHEMDISALDEWVVTIKVDNRNIDIDRVEAVEVNSTFLFNH